MARFGDLSSSGVRAYAYGLAVSYTVVPSQYAAPLHVTYRIEGPGVAPMLVYYLVVPPTGFTINGDATIVSPDMVNYIPRPVTGRTLLAEPLLQGFRTMTWTWSVLRESEAEHLFSFYDPQNPWVILVYPDETGTWRQVRAAMLPPQYGVRETVSVTNVVLTFTGLL